MGGRNGSRKLRRTILSLAALLAGPVAEADVAPGAIVVIRVNSQTPYDSFTWLALQDIQAGDTIRWTDSSWGAIPSDEGRYGWNPGETANFVLAEGFIPAGTMGDVVTGAMLADRDQLFFYTGSGPGARPSAGSEADVGFVWGMTWGGDWLDSGAVLNSASYAPVGLTNLGMAMALDVGTHWYYQGPLTGSTQELFDLIRNPDNWGTTASTGTTWAEVVAAEASSTVPEPATAAAVAALAVLAATIRRDRAHAGN